MIEPGKQTRFLRTVKKQLDLTWEEMAKMCKVSRATLHNWVSERYNMSFEVLLLLHEQGGESLPSCKVISEEERIRSAARKGGQVCYELHGRPDTPEGSRKGGQKVWQLQRERPECYTRMGFQRKEILIPCQSPLLAEFVCILLGDGEIRDYEVAVYLNGTKEHEYAESVARCFKQLFNLTATISPKGNVIRVRACSANLVEYLESIGLHRGNKVKQQVNVPAWLLHGERDYLIAGVRGLMDTDGGIVLETRRGMFTTRHYVALRFSNSSLPLLDGMWEMLKELRYRPIRDAKYGHVKLNRQEEIRRYYTEGGTSNVYHMRQYIEKARDAWGRDVSDEISFTGR